MERVFSDFKTKSLRETIVMSFFTIFCVNTLMEASSLSLIDGYWLTNILLKFICCAVFSIDFLIDIFNRKVTPTIWMWILGVFSVITFIISRGYGSLVILALFAFFSKRDFKIVLNHVLNIMKIGLFVIITLAFFKVIPDLLHPRSPTQMRHSLGFIYALVPSFRFLFIVLITIYLKRTNISYKEILLLAIASICMYLLTSSRADTMLIMLTLLVLVVAKIFKNYKDRIDKFINKKSIKILLILFPIIVSLFIISISYFYNKDINLFMQLNRLLSDRLRLSKNAFSNYGFTLFGQKIKWIGYGSFSIPTYEEYNYVDSAIVCTLFDNGIVGLVLKISLFCYIVSYAIKNKDNWLLWAVLVILIESIVSGGLMNYSAGNYFIFIISFLFVKTKKISCVDYCNYYAYEKFYYNLNHLNEVKNEK